MDGSRQRLARIVDRARDVIDAARATALAADIEADPDQAPPPELLARIAVILQRDLPGITLLANNAVWDVGSVWLAEGVANLHGLPRILIGFRSRRIEPEAPAAELSFAFHLDGTVTLSWGLLSPLRHTHIRIRHLDALSPACLAEELDDFLAAAIASGTPFERSADDPAAAA